jgi:hypothetical protein
VDKVGVVHQDGHVAAVVAEALEGVVDVDGEEAVVKSYLRKILMPTWKSITRKQSRKIELIIMFYCLAITISRGLLLCGDATISYILCISAKILLKRKEEKTTRRVNC